MRIGRILSFFPIAGFLAIFPASPSTVFAQGEARGQKNTSLTDPSYERIVVAEVGGVKITAQEFLLNYGFGPAFTKREKDSKLRYLNFMIYEKLFALDAYERGLQNRRLTREALSDIEGDLATEELYTQDVAKRVSVTPKEIATGIRLKRVSLSLEWVYAPTESAVAVSEKLLQGGASFDSVYTLQIHSGADPADRSLRTTQFDLQMKNPVLAKIVDSLKAGVVSLPIHVDDGWYIVRVAERTKDAVTTESEAVRQREDVHRALVERESDRLSDQYVNQILTDAKATIERRGFDIVQAHIAATIVPHETFAQWDMGGLLVKKWGPLDVSDIAPFKSLTIVTTGQGRLTVGDFLRWYDARSTLIRLKTTSAPAFFSSFEGVVWRMVRDTLLVGRAFQRHLQLAHTVQQQKKWWEEKVLFELEKSMISDSLPRDSAHVRDYYTRNERDFRDSTGRVRSFEHVADDVLRAYYASAMTERMLHRVLALKARYNVTVHEAALDRLVTDPENDPGAIDVYSVKKGGTFPHPAFPTIDLGWQEWH